MNNKVEDVYHRIAKIKEAIVMQVDNDYPKIWDSKVGGMPYLLENDEYPLSHDNASPFEFLLQINCKDLPINDYLPTRGLIQFFLNKNYNFSSDDKPYEIRYIPYINKDENKIDYELDEEEYYGIDEDDEDDEEDDEDDETTDYEYKISFVKKDDHINSSTIEWNDFKRQLAKELVNQKDELDDYDSLLEEDVYFNDLNFILEDDDVVEVLQSSKLFGYPDNDDEDPRSSDVKYKDYILLLQLHPESEFFKKEEEVMCWFIHPDDLKQLNFNNVLCSYFNK